MNEDNKVLKNYTVVVEVLVPTTLKYYVSAYSPEEAADLNKVKSIKPNFNKPHQTLTKYKKITVYDRGMSIIRYIRNIF